MWPFRRRKVGKHALGAAVTAIPSAPRPVLPQTAAVMSAAVGVNQSTPADGQLLQLVAQLEPGVPGSVPRVELGFRDGSTAALAPGSEQAKALTEIASALARRN